MSDLDRIKSNVAKMAGMNAPEDDIDGYISSEGVSVDDVRNHVVTPDNASFVDRVKQDYQGRLAEGQDAADAYVAGDQSLPLTYLDFGGKVGVGTAADAMGEAVKSAASYAPQGLKDAVGTAISTVADAPLGIIPGTPRDLAQQAGQVYDNVSQRYPDQTRHVEAAANILGMLAPEVPFKGKSLAGAVVEKAKPTGNFLKEVGKDLLKKPSDIAAKSAVQEVGTLGQQAKAAAKSDYNLFDEIGGGLHRDQVSDFSTKINSLRPKDPAKAAIWHRSGVKDAMDTINSAVGGGELSFSGAHALRADVNSQLKMAYMAGDSTKASHLMQIKDNLTDVLTNPDNASHLDIKAKNAWQNANHEFAKGALLEDLELLAAKASGKAQPANSLDTAVNGFLNDKRKSGALLPSERAALEDVVKKTQTGELLKSGATRLIPAIGAGVGGPAGFLVGHYGSMLSRTTAEALKLKKLDKVYDLINNRAAPEALTHKPPLLLTHDRRGTLERNIGQRKAYETSKGYSSAPINLGQEKQLALPSPEMPTPPGVGKPRSGLDPMRDRQIKIAQKIMEGTDKPLSNDLSGAAIKTPASQSLKLDESLKGIKKQQLNNMRAKLINGEISQNKFTETARSRFGLNTSQAKDLAKEIMRYEKK